LAGLSFSTEESVLEVVEISDLIDVKNERLLERVMQGRSPKTRQFIALRDGAEAGLLIYEDWGRPESFIYEIFVLLDFRKDGIGTWLLLYAEQLAARLGRTCVRLTPRSLAQEGPNDEDLRSWYERKGYVRSALVKGTLEKRLSVASA
jgi:GNAT superfamily N-acetyltransferase